MSTGFEHWLSALKVQGDNGNIACRNLHARLTADSYRTAIPKDLREAYEVEAGRLYATLATTEIDDEELLKVHDDTLEQWGRRFSLVGPRVKNASSLAKVVSAEVLLKYYVDPQLSNCPTPIDPSVDHFPSIMMWLTTPENQFVERPGAWVRGSSNTTTFATCRAKLLDAHRQHSDASTTCDLLGMPVRALKSQQMVALLYPDEPAIPAHRPTVLDSVANSYFVSQPANPPHPSRYDDWGCAAISGAERARRLNAIAFDIVALRGHPEVVHEPIPFTNQFSLFDLGVTTARFSPDPPDLSPEIMGA